MRRLTILMLCVTVFLVGPAASAQADTATQLPFPNGNAVSIVVDPGGSHVFVSGGPGNSSVVVLNYSGQLVKTISGEGGAAGMALDAATHTLYVALHDQTAISEINTQTLTETKRFSTAPYAGPSSLVIAGSKLWFSCFEGQTGCLASANLDGSGLGAAPGISGFSTFPALLAAGGSNNHLLALADRTVSPPNIAVYDMSGASPTLVKQIHADGSVSDASSMTFTPNGANLLLATGAPYYIQSLATTTLLPSGQYPTGPYPTSVAVTGDGKFVAGGVNPSSANDLFVYPAASTTPVRTWNIGTSNTANPLTAGSLAFSPDASRLFAVTQDAATGHLVFDVLDQPTIPLKPSTTSLKSSTKTVRYGAHTSLKVALQGPATGKVDLYATTSVQTKQLVATASVQSGAATFTVKPKLNTTYSAQFQQGSGWATSASGEVRVAVSPVVTVAPRPGGTVVYQGHRASRTWLTGKVNPKRPPGAPLGYLIQRRMNGHWRTDISTQFAIENDGRAHVFFLTNKPGLCRVRVTYLGDSDFVHGASAWKKFRAHSPG
jgi:hypothetical protein